MSDTAIRASLRAVLHRNHIDITSLQYGAFRGVVRLGGAVRTTFTHALPKAEVLEVIEQQTRSIRGVKRVELRFDNVDRDLEGNWIPVEPVEANVIKDLEENWIPIEPLETEEPVA